MVKSVIYTAVAILMSLALFIGVEFYVDRQFDEFYAAVHLLYEKVQEGHANRQDCNAVLELWQDKKEHLHLFLPHNDISYLDYWLGEACGLITVGRLDEALCKVEVVQNIATKLPDAYRLKWENIL